MMKMIMQSYQLRKESISASLLKSARNGECDIEELCIACSRTNCEIKGPHPYFIGGLCEHCKVLYTNSSLHALLT